jgi:hypothetical protein
MTTPSTTVDEVAEAEQAAKAAEAHVDDIEARLLDADPTVTAADLIAAEDDAAAKRGLLARVVDFRARREERDLEKVRLARLDEIRQTIRTEFGAHEGDVVDAFDAAVVVLGALVAKVEGYNAEVADLFRLLQAGELKPLPADLRISDASGMIRLAALDVSVGPIGMLELLAETVTVAMEGTGVGIGPLDKLNRPAEQLRRVALAAAERPAF